MLCPRHEVEPAVVTTAKTRGTGAKAARWLLVEVGGQTADGLRASGMTTAVDRHMPLCWVLVLVSLAVIGVLTTLGTTLKTKIQEIIDDLERDNPLGSGPERQ